MWSNNYDASRLRVLKGARDAVPIVGAAELLESLHSRGAFMGVLTRNSKANAIATLDKCRFERYFEAFHVLGRDEAFPKPNPDGILTLLTDWGTLPPTAVMVGDSSYDVDAGRRAYVTTVLFEESQKERSNTGNTNGRRSDELSVYSMVADYDFRVSSHAELLDLFTPHA